MPESTLSSQRATICTSAFYRSAIPRYPATDMRRRLETQIHLRYLLIPSGSSRLQESVPHGDRAFDAIPGLSLALAADPLDVRIHATLHSGVTLTFDIPVPDVEPAVVLKALAWNNRHAPRDVADLCSLFAIVHEHQLHKDRWKLTTAKGGTRLDTSRALHSLVAMIDREQPIEGLTMPAPRLAALIRAYVGEPG